MRQRVSRTAAVLCALAIAAPAASQPASTTTNPAALRRLIDAVQEADYRGDLTKLRSLPGEMERFTTEPALAEAAHYWRGFAHWRHALNSLNDGVPADSVDADFARAITEFRAVLRIDPSDVEARIGLAAGLGNRAFFNRQAPASAAPFLAEYVPLIAEIERSAPDNPRMIFVVAAAYFHAPPDRGRDRPKAIALLERGIARASVSGDDSTHALSPSWGEAELHMLLSYLVQNLTPPDHVTAMRHAEAALALRPDWHYVRDVLIPQIRGNSVGWWTPNSDRPEQVPATVDSAIAAAWFAEANAICERDAGRLWGVSLCGPMVIADAASRTRATSQPAPGAPQPAAVGYANAALRWGDTRWTILVWQMMPRDQRMRARLLLHELFHRVQPELGLMMPDSSNVHLDTPDGRYWLQLEWRALARALVSAGTRRDAAVRDALGFRATRRRIFPSAAASERALETTEGLPQYTGTVLSTGGNAEAASDAVTQLQQAPVINESFVRTFAYPSGAAYGVLLEAWSPGWTRRFHPGEDLGDLLATASGLRPTTATDSAAARYGGAELRVSEDRREAERRQRVAELRRRFVTNPVIVLPNGRSNSFVTNGMTPIPDIGTVYPTFRTQGDWGSVSAAQILMSADRQQLTLPAPAVVEGSVLSGEGWTLTLAPGWIVRPGRRSGDFEVVRATAGDPPAQ